MLSTLRGELTAVGRGLGVNYVRDVRDSAYLTRRLSYSASGLCLIRLRHQLTLCYANCGCMPTYTIPLGSFKTTNNSNVETIYYYKSV